MDNIKFVNNLDDDYKNEGDGGEEADDEKRNNDLMADFDLEENEDEEDEEDEEGF